MSSNENPIGVFDSGVGCLTVVRALRAALPGEHIVYLGDTARVPYGSKSPETVARYSLACARFLLEKDVKLILIACNTASSHAMEALGAAVPVPVIGAVEPGAKAALDATTSGHVGVVGTLGTIRSESYVKVLKRFSAKVNVHAQACPLLVPLAEEGWVTGQIAESIVNQYVDELATKGPEIDTIVLGCTHYPLLLGLFTTACERRFGRPIKLVDSATAMATHALGVLVMRVGMRKFDGTAGSLNCFVTDASRLEELAPRFLGEPLSSFSTVDLKP